MDRLDELAEADRMMERLAGKLGVPAQEWIKTWSKTGEGRDARRF